MENYYAAHFSFSAFVAGLLPVNCYTFRGFRRNTVRNSCVQNRYCVYCILLTSHMVQRLQHVLQLTVFSALQLIFVVHVAYYLYYVQLYSS